MLVGLAGWGAGQLLQHTVPLGEDVGANPTARALLEDPSAPSHEVRRPTLTMVVFTDYQCAACKRANPAMERAVASDGHVRIVYKDWPIFGPLSEQAARVALASDRQGLYPAVHNRLMTDRRPLGETVLREAVERAGGDWGRIQRDLRDHEAAIRRQLDLNRGHAFSLGIQGTPAYLIGPILVVGGLDEAAFGRAFAQARNAARS